ncbi:hypothetical protein NXW09_29095 [Bacteroides ovatus]|nr:hypothetical protein [Bacteroides ovatus]
MATHRFHGYAPQGNGRQRTYREIRVASLHHTGAGARCDLVGITACRTVGLMDRLTCLWRNGWARLSANSP